MTDRSDKAGRPVDAVSSPQLSAPPEAPAPDPPLAEAEGAPEQPSEGSGLRRFTGSPSDPQGDSEDRPSGERNLTGEAQRKAYLGCTIDDRYHVETVLGEGGMGVVYRCTHTIIGKKVAMKVLRADLARSEEVTERFLNEAKSASSIGNPHIIDISDFGRLPDGSTYFIMEYLNGQALSNVVDKGGPVPIQRLIHIAEQLAEGLFAAHQAGIVHRDLKPDNVFLVSRGGRDFVKILDFGIAKASSTEGKLTQAGQVFGTPHYMSPEQAAGSPIDHRADIYSLGVILYEMASGKVPFDADNFMGILTQHMYKSPIPIRALVPVPQEVPPGLEAIILKCLSKRPEQRYGTMRQLQEDLVKARDGNVPTAVAELMHRSGGFHIPRDYPFRDGGRPHALIPASPRSSAPRWPLYAGAVSFTCAVVLLGAIYARNATDSSSPGPSSAPGAQSSTNAAPPAPDPLAATPNAPEARQVILAVAPLDAHVYRGNEDLGTSPVILDVPKGNSMTLRVRKVGYEEAEVHVDGTENKLSVTLQPKPHVSRQIAKHKAAPPLPQKADPIAEPAPKPSKPSSSEIVNPWE